MTKRQAIKLFGGVCKLARALGIRSQAVSQWRDGRIGEPRASQVKLTAIEHGLLKLSSITLLPNPKGRRYSRRYSRRQNNRLPAALR
jgi:DNA-binding transcriptional regulator YdaS (Cro superfamily)